MSFANERSASPSDNNYAWPPNNKKRIDWFSHWYRQTPSLPSLPEELLLLITSHLEGDTPTLSHLSLTNRKLNRVTKETLYRSISVGKHVASSSLIFLVRTLLQRPEYCSLVKNLWLSAYFYDKRGPVAGSLFPRHCFGRVVTDRFDKFGESEYALLIDCCRKIDSWVPLTDRSGRRGAELLVAQRWKAAVLQRQSPAFAALLLALCPSLTFLSFDVSHTEGGGRLVLPRMFGFAAAEEVAEWEFCLSEENLPVSFPGSPGLRMPEVRYLRVNVVNNIDIVRLGFGKLTTLDVGLYVHYGNSGSGMIEDRYGSTHVNPSRQVKCIPGVRNLVFRVDYEELMLPSSGEQVSRFLRHVEFPQLVSLTIVLERSPREHWKWNRVRVSFERLISQLRNPTAQTLLHNLEELKVLITDDTAAFDKKFLHRFQPCTSLAWLPRLKKLTIPWQALTQSAGLTDQVLDTEEVLPVADLPPSLEVLRILYPHVHTPHQLARMFESAMGQFSQLRELELLFNKHWGMLDGGLRPVWHRVLGGLPAKFSLDWTLSVKDEIKALTASSSK